MIFLLNLATNPLQINIVFSFLFVKLIFFKWDFENAQEIYILCMMMILQYWCGCFKFFCFLNGNLYKQTNNNIQAILFGIFTCIILFICFSLFFLFFITYFFSLLFNICLMCLFVYTSFHLYKKNIPPIQWM